MFPRKSRFIQCVLEIFLQMFKIETAMLKFLPRKHFVGNFPTHVQNRDSSDPTKIKPTITFCRKLSYTFVGS